MTGTVLTLRRWPVKSMGGEEVDRLHLDERGVAGDRTHALFDVGRGGPRRLTARESPQLLAWRASYSGAHPLPATPPTPLLTDPDGTTHAWDEAGLATKLGAALGRPLVLRRDLAGIQDLERSVLVTTAATHAGLERELGRPLDVRRWRTNVHVELDAPAFAEEDWEGRVLTIGAARFVLLHPCERCVIPTRDPDTQVKDAAILKHLFVAHRGLMGMNARPLGLAEIAVGDRVTIEGAT